MTKRRRKETMIRSKVRNKFNKSLTSVNLRNYKMQRNKFTKILRNTKQQYFNNLLRIADTKKFEKIVKPFFSNKSKTANTVILHKK